MSEFDLIKESKKTGDLYIPGKIWFDKQLTGADKCLMGVLLKSMDSDNLCYNSNLELSTICHVGTATITRSIQRLKSLGYLQEINFDGRIRTLQISIEKSF